jgi:hypothetical protein
MNKYIRKHKIETSEYLRDAFTHSPKAFWRLLKPRDKPNNSNGPELDTLFNYFKHINENIVTDNTVNADFIPLTVESTDDLNKDITLEEMCSAIKRLKRNKAAGLDMVENDYLIDSFEKLGSLLVSYFNLVLTTGIMPDQWLIGAIKPIYKNKGDINSPNSYRPITILSCVGKLFTGILNNRLNNFLESNNILTSAQSGFRKGFSTIDNAFILHLITHLFKHSNKKLFCIFIDFAKAFDNIWRIGLWHKLLSNSITGKFFTLVKNMYSNIKSCVMVNGITSEYFNSYAGVRQGENLSPVLFSLYINDLEQFLCNKDCEGITIKCPNNDAMSAYLRLFILLYADDTVLFAENPGQLQLIINYFNEYCETWKLEVNISKTKVVIFGGGPAKNSKLSFYFGDKEIQITDSYVYLGIKFHRLFAIKDMVTTASKAMFCLLKRARNINLPLDIIIKSFDVMVQPILIYGCEVWGYENLPIIEKLHLKFLKLAAGLKSSTPTYMVYGELGALPINIAISKRIVRFWHSLTDSNKQLKYSNKLYHVMNLNNVKTKWLEHVQTILNDCGLTDVYINPHLYSQQWLCSQVERIRTDHFLQAWNSDIKNSSKGLYYQYFKSSPMFEKYLLLPKSISIPLLKFRTTNHHLPVECGRWLGIPRLERTCKLCNSPSVADEFHYMFRCQFFTKDREQFIPTKYSKWPNLITFSRLMNIVKIKDLKKLATYINIIHRALK